MKKWGKISLLYLKIALKQVHPFGKTDNIM